MKSIEKKEIIAYFLNLLLLGFGSLDFGSLDFDLEFLSESPEEGASDLSELSTSLLDKCFASIKHAGQSSNSTS